LGEIGKKYRDRLAFVAAVFVGAVQELEVVWTFADIMNGLMELPNLVGLWAYRVSSAERPGSTSPRPNGASFLAFDKQRTPE